MNNDTILEEYLHMIELRFPVLFLIDTSSSMTGQPINEIISAINHFRNEAVNNKELKGSLDVAVVEFDSTVRVVQDFITVEYMDLVSFSTCGVSNKRLGLQMAIDMINDRVNFYRSREIHCYIPWIILLTDDGCPSEPVEDIAKTIKQYEDENRLKLRLLLTSGSEVKQSVVELKRPIYLKEISLVDYLKDVLHKDYNYYYFDNDDFKP